MLKPLVVLVSYFALQNRYRTTLERWCSTLSFAMQFRLFRHSRYICAACYNGHIDVIKYLVENRANFKAKNHLALCIARKNKHNDIVGFLLDQGSKFPTAQQSKQKI